MILDLKSPRFSRTSTKYRFLQITTQLSLKLMGRQTLHTHWFLRFLLRHMCLFGPLRTPHVRQCNVWAPPPFQTCFRFACRLAKHLQPSAQSAGGSSPDAECAPVSCLRAHMFAMRVPIHNMPINIHSSSHVALSVRQMCARVLFERACRKRKKGTRTVE